MDLIAKKQRLIDRGYDINKKIIEKAQRLIDKGKLDKNKIKDPKVKEKVK